jgi:hypothetical protein
MTRRFDGATWITVPALFTLFGAGCADAPSSSSNVIVRDSAGIRIVENRVADAPVCVVSAEPTLDIGALEGAAEYQLYRVFDAATLSDGRTAVVNQGSNQIRLYRPDGTFDDAFGSEGDGPGEFRSVFQLWVRPGDTLVVGDYRPYRFSTFTSDGEYVGAVVPEPMYVNTPNSIDPLADGAIVTSDEELVSSATEGEWHDVSQWVMIHRPDGSLLDTLATLPYGRYGLVDAELSYFGRPMFEALSYVTAGDSRIIAGRGRDNELEVFRRGDGSSPGDSMFDLSRPSDLIRWAGPDRTVTDGHVAAVRDGVRERLRNAESDFSRRFAEADLRDRPVADRFPPHASLQLQRGGDLWVQEYPRPGEGDAGWMVFDREGHLQCRASLPYARSWDVYEIGADYVLGKVEDELGVEHVVKYALTRP